MFIIFFFTKIGFFLIPSDTQRANIRLTTSKNLSKSPLTKINKVKADGCISFCGIGIFVICCKAF